MSMLLCLHSSASSAGLPFLWLSQLPRLPCCRSCLQLCPVPAAGNSPTQQLQQVTHPLSSSCSTTAQCHSMQRQLHKSLLMLHVPSRAKQPAGQVSPYVCASTLTGLFVMAPTRQAVNLSKETDSMALPQCSCQGLSSKSQP